MINNFRTDVISGDILIHDKRATLILSLFYCVELEKQLKWPEQERFQIQQIVSTMIRCGESVMIMASDSSGMPIGMLVYTKTTNDKIRRIEALFVIEQFRGNRIAEVLLTEAKGDCDFHTFATPDSVSWYERNGFRKLGDHEGTVEMTTSDEKPDYSFNRVIPLLRPNL
jgi:GNAT superfamily N-acetyltransferase